MARAVAVAGVLAAALVGVHLAAGGGEYGPTRPADPCTREVRVGGETDVMSTAQRVGLIALDATAPNRSSHAPAYIDWFPPPLAPVMAMRSPSTSGRPRR